MTLGGSECFSFCEADLRSVPDFKSAEGSISILTCCCLGALDVEKVAALLAGPEDWSPFCSGSLSIFGLAIAPGAAFLPVGVFLFGI